MRSLRQTPKRVADAMLDDADERSGGFAGFICREKVPTLDLRIVASHEVVLPAIIGREHDQWIVADAAFEFIGFDVPCVNLRF